MQDEETQLLADTLQADDAESVESLDAKPLTDKASQPVGAGAGAEHKTLSNELKRRQPASQQGQGQAAREDASELQAGDARHGGIITAGLSVGDQDAAADYPSLEEEHAKPMSS